MLLELSRAKPDLFRLGVFDVGQLPLTRCCRDPPTDIAFDWVARQDDFGTARVGQHDIQHAGVVVIEKPESAQRCVSFDGVDHPFRFGVAQWLRHAEKIGAIRIADEMRIKCLTMAL